MGNPFSSSTQSKPLRFLFLLALFVLRAGNVSSSITPSSLKHFDILKLQNPISYLPQEEPGKVSFTPTNNSLSFSFDFEEKTSVKLDIASISPNLFERPLITSKSSSLLGNNRKVIGEFIHESPSSPLLIAAPLEERTIAHPITEKKEQKKDLLSEQIASKPSLQTPSPSSILPFDHPSTSSTLIDRKFFLEKPSSSHPEKRQLPKSSSLTNSYFDNGAWIDMNHLVENNNNPLFLPSYEESSKPKLFEQIIPTPDLIFQKETLFFSEKKELFLPLAQVSFTIDKPLPHRQSLIAKSFEPSPYLNLWKKDPEFAQKTYDPEKEEIISNPQCYSLARAPSFALDVGSEVFSFTMAPPFDLFSSEDGITPPKKLQKFIASGLEIEPSFFSTDVYETLAACPLSPKIEHSPPPFFSEDRLTLHSSVETPSSIPFQSLDIEESLPLIGGKIVFPEGKTQPGHLKLKEVESSLSLAPREVRSETNMHTPFSEPVSHFFGKDSYNFECLFSLNSGKSVLFTEQSLHYSLINEEPTLPKFEGWASRSTLSLNTISLPLTKDKKISPQKHLAKKHSLLEVFPQMDKVITKGPNVHLEQGEKIVPLKDTLHTPLLPSYYPPDVPQLNMEDTSLATLENQLDFIKTRGAYDFTEMEELPLPYMGKKEIDPSKHPITPKRALEDLPSPGMLFNLAKRDLQYPNTKELVAKGALPTKIHTELSIAVAKIEEPETEMIHSQSREILEDYDQENRASTGLLSLASANIQTLPSESDIRSLNQGARFTRAFLTEISPPSYLETSTYTNEFTTEVHYSKRDDGKGYLFALKMQPKNELHFSSPHQNFIFVIDGSSSIKKHRFEVFKEGVKRSLSYLQEGDSFNIVVADAELTPFSSTSTSWDQTTISQARRFLESHPYRGFFINYDPFDLLAKVTQYITPEKENVIVLVTDGHTFSGIKQHKEDFQELSLASKGRFSIFTATASQNNNLVMLDLLSTFNNGELMYSKTHAAFSRQLAVMVKHIEHLVAKDIHVTVTGTDLETGIEFYPNQEALPALYSDRPYTIYGTINELKDFDLILQGRAGNQWINVKQHISFKHAEKASNSIKRGFAMQKAYVCYDYYFKKEDPFFLSEAEKILNPHSIPTATR